MAQVGSTSLDLYRESLPHPERARCPRKLGFVLVHTVSGEVVPARCKTNSCGYCGPVNARLVAGAIALARPERFVTFTLVGSSWQEVRGRMFRLRYWLRSSGLDVSWCWHVEPNPEGTGHHVHAYQRGGFLPQRELSRGARRVGMGSVVWVERLSEPDPVKLGYGLKLAGIEYGLKLAEAEASLASYLGCNGRRLVHTSRGFFEVEGRKVGQREAMQAWARLVGRRDGLGDPEGTWQLVKVEQLESALMRLAAGRQTP